MNIRISAFREMPDARAPVASNQPHRKNAADPIDPRLECPLGRMRVKGQITEGEYEAGCRWRDTYHNWLRSIGAPNPFPAAVDLSSYSGIQEPLSSALTDDERDEAVAKAFRVGEKILKGLGPRVFHAVSAVVVYEEPEELGDFEFTAAAAKKGLTALAELFG